MLHKKTFGGNLAIKIDIAKVQPLVTRFNLSLFYAKMFILVSEKQDGFFDCVRGCETR
jgi:hypothetical protein